MVVTRLEPISEMRNRGHLKVADHGPTPHMVAPVIMSATATGKVNRVDANSSCFFQNGFGELLKNVDISPRLI